MGWGEPKGPSDEMVRRSEERRRADALSAAVTAFLKSHTTGDRERMQFALDEYREARYV